MIARLRELFNRIDNHVDMLDELNEILEKTIKRLRGHYGY